MNKHTTYVYLEREDMEVADLLDDEEVCCTLVPLIHEHDFWSYWQENVETPRAWQSKLSKMPEGFYELRFETFTDHEYSEGYKIYSYECLNEESFELIPSPIWARGRYWMNCAVDFARLVRYFWKSKDSAARRQRDS